MFSSKHICKTVAVLLGLLFLVAAIGIPVSLALTTTDGYADGARLWQNVGTALLWALPLYLCLFCLLLWLDRMLSAKRGDISRRTFLLWTVVLLVIELSVVTALLAVLGRELAALQANLGETLR